MYKNVKGGGWGLAAGFCRSAYRDYFSPGYRYENFGFRLIAERQESSNYVLRGGAWVDGRLSCRSASRYENAHDGKGSDGGFRLIARRY